MLPTLEEIEAAQKGVEAFGAMSLDELGAQLAADNAAAAAQWERLPMQLEMTAAKYHSDPCPKPSLSASIAHIITSKSPLHAYIHHPRLGRVVRESTPEMDYGTLVHALTLGQKPDLEIIHEDNWRKAKAQAKRDQAHADGRTPVLARDYEDATAVAKSIHAVLRKEGIELTGVSEQVFVWEEDTPAGKVLCRARMDHVIPERGLIIDFKTIRSAHPDQITRSIMDHGYHIQAEAYKSAVRQLVPEMAGREQFRWVFIEVLPDGSPDRVCLTIAKPSGSLRELGTALWRKACETWARCLTSGRWPGYAEGDVIIEPPPWALKEELGR